MSPQQLVDSPECAGIPLKAHVENAMRIGISVEKRSRFIVRRLGIAPMMGRRDGQLIACCFNNLVSAQKACLLMRPLKSDGNESSKLQRSGIESGGGFATQASIAGFD
jgi:hypothetical protein